MRIVAILTLGILMGCSSSNKTLDIKDLAGDWVNTKYLKSVQKTKSARISQYACEYSYITVKSDTALFILSFHEGMDLKIIPNKMNSFYCIGYNNDTIKLIVSNDTMIVNHTANQDTFLKYPMQFPNESLTNRLLTKEIFSGDYVNVDSANHILSFKDDGLVNGFLNYSSYFVQDDYVDAGCNLDILYLRNMPDDRFEYTWTYLNDTLIIYKLDCQEFDTISKRCVITKKGKLIYRLVKK